jgi:hypothetical protein
MNRWRVTVSSRRYVRRASGGSRQWGQSS